MKKISVVFLSLILAFSLVACDKDKIITEGGDGAVLTGHYSVPDTVSQNPEPSFAVSQGNESVDIVGDKLYAGFINNIGRSNAAAEVFVLPLLTGDVDLKK